MDYIERIREFLGEDEGRVFAQRAREFGMAEDGPELLPLIVLAKATERTEAAARLAAEALDTTRTEVAAIRNVFGTLREELVQSIGGDIEDRMTAAFDDLEREIAAKARALAHAEFTAAATVRSRAIVEEVQELRRVATEGLSGGGTGAVASDMAEGFAFTWREVVTLLVAAASAGAVVATLVAMFVVRLAPHAVAVVR